MTSDLPLTFQGRMTRLLELARGYTRVPTPQNRIIHLLQMVETTVAMAEDQEDGWLFLGEDPRYVLWLRDYPKSAQCLCACLMVVRDIVMQTSTRKQAFCKSILAESRRLGLPRLIRKCASLEP